MVNIKKVKEDVKKIITDDYCEATCKALKINDKIYGCANPIKVVQDSQATYKLSVVGWD